VSLFWSDLVPPQSGLNETLRGSLLFLGLDNLFVMDFDFASSPLVWRLGAEKLGPNRSRSRLGRPPLLSLGSPPFSLGRRAIRLPVLVNLEPPSVGGLAPSLSAPWPLEDSNFISKKWLIPIPICAGGGRPSSARVGVGWIASPCGVECRQMLGVSEGSDVLFLYYSVGHSATPL